MAIKYHFSSRTAQNGKIIPIIIIESSHFEMLGNLGNGHLLNPQNVKNEISKIEDVRNGKIDKHTVAGDDWCIIEVEKGKCTVYNGFDEFEPFEIELEELISLLSDWSEFLSESKSN